MARKKSLYTTIHIIYNPNSTGDSKQLATELKAKLRKELPVQIKLLPTKYAGHAEELAYELAIKNNRPLIISSSGDGGYHEVVNGVMRAQAEGRQAICAVLPAGNANDHASAMQNDELWSLILKGKPQKIDLLKIKVSGGKESLVRYAHSYAGIGLTAVVATELNTKDLNPLNEKWLVLKKLYAYRPFTIVHGGEIHRLDSLLFANINRMAKVLTISETNTPADGKFEVVSFPYQKKTQLFRKIIKSTITSLQPKSYKKYEFTTVKKTLMQLDGEVIELPPDCKVLVSVDMQVLETFC